MTSRRRQVLASTGSILLAGCLSEISNDTQSDSVENGRSPSEDGCSRPAEGLTLADDADPEPSGTGFPELSVGGDSIPNDHASGLRALVGVAQQYGSQRIAKVQIDLVNRGESPVSVSSGPSLPFSSYHNTSEQDGPRVYLVPQDDADVGVNHVNAGKDGTAHLQSPVDGCWKIDSVGFNSIAEYCTIPAGHVVSGEYVVYADAANENCLPEGEYRFDQTWSGAADGSDYQLDWGFSLTVECSDSSNRAAFLVR